MNNITADEYTKVSLIDDMALNKTFSADYWNDAEAEKQKIWGKWETDFESLYQSFLKKGLVDQVEQILKDQNIDFNNKLIASLASGICLLEAVCLQKHPEISKIINLEFSKHRIFEIAPHIFSKLNISSEKVELRLGSFLETGIETGSLDFVILSQAFHHSDQPIDLLNEVGRILKPDGKVLIVGEHYFTPLQIAQRYIKHFPKYFLNHRSYRSKSALLPSWRAVFPVDEKKGDHHYNLSGYKEIFDKTGFGFKRYIFEEYKNQAFILFKK